MEIVPRGNPLFSSSNKTGIDGQNTHVTFHSQHELTLHDARSTKVRGDDVEDVYWCFRQEYFIAIFISGEVLDIRN